MADPNYAVAVRQAEDSFRLIAKEENILKWEKEVNFALRQIQRNEDLRNATPNSLRNAVISAAEVGLTLNPDLGHAYLVPWKGHASLMPGYKGLVHLAVSSGCIRSMNADLVYANDIFVERRGTTPVFEHTPKRGKERGALIGAYCYWTNADGSFDWEFVEVTDLEQARDASKMKSGAVWTKWKGEMQKKVAIKRASKRWQLTPRLAGQFATINKLDGYDLEREAHRTVDGESKAVVSADEAAMLREAVGDDDKLRTLLFDAYAITDFADLPAAEANAAMDRITRYKEAKATKATKPAGTATKRRQAARAAS